MGNNVTLIPKQPARHSLLTNVENVVYMPLASRHSHGIVKIGNGLNVTSDGLLSVDVNSEWYATIREDVDQLKVSVQDLKTDVDTALMDVSDINEKLSDIENGSKLISVYQTKHDSGLVTINKTVVGGINEIKNQTTLNINNIESVKNDLTGVKRDYAPLKYVDDLYANISMGGSKSYVFETREQFIAWLDGVYEREDSFKPELLNIGDIVLIEEMGVPDYWVKSKSSPMTINDFREYEAKIDVPEVKVDDISINKNAQGELQTIAIKQGRLIVGDTVSKSDFKGWIELKSVEQFKQLVEYGSILVDGETIVYDENSVYVTPEPYAEEYVTLELFVQNNENIQTRIDNVAGAIEMKADRAVVDQNTVDILRVQSTITELTPDVMRALKIPMSTPAELKIVGVSTSNEQEMLNLGDGLSVENGDLTVDNTIAKSDLSNVTYPEVVANGVAQLGAGDRIIERWISSDGQTWYEKYASGWKRCGMTNQTTSSSGSQKLTLPIGFTTPNVTVTYSANNSSNLVTIKCKMTSDAAADGLYYNVNVATGSSSSSYVSSTCCIYCCGY